VYSLGTVPLYVQRDRRAHAGQLVHLAGIAKFFLCGGSGGGLNKLSKTCAGVGKTPGRDLNPKFFKRPENAVRLRRIHGKASGGEGYTRSLSQVTIFLRNPNILQCRT